MKSVKVDVGSWVLNVEETQKFASKGIFVFDDGETRKKVYCRLAPTHEIINYNVSFYILHPNELSGLAETVEIEESLNQKLYAEPKSIDIEESSQDDAQEQADKLKKETAEWMEEQKKKNASVTINIHGAKPKGSEEGSALPIDSQDVETAKELVEIGKERLLKKAQKLGVASLIDVDSVKSPRDVEKIAEKLKEFEEKKREVVSGNAPLSPEQLGQSTEKIGFDSIEDMIRSLRKAENSGSEEAKLVIDELMRKSFRGLQKGSMPIKEVEGDALEYLEKTKPTNPKLRDLEIEPKKRSKRIHPKSAIRTEVER